MLSLRICRRSAAPSAFWFIRPWRFSNAPVRRSCTAGVAQAERHEQTTTEQRESINTGLHGLFFITRKSLPSNPPSNNQKIRNPEPVRSMQRKSVRHWSERAWKKPRNTLSFFMQNIALAAQIKSTPQHHPSDKHSPPPPHPPFAKNICR